MRTAEAEPWAAVLLFQRKPQMHPHPTGASNSLARAVASNEDRHCDWPHCGRSRRGLGRYCAPHSTNLGRTGHPAALHVPRRTWAPFIEQAESFLRENLCAEHRSVEAAIRWIGAELAQAERPTNPDPARLVYQAALLRAHRNGVSPMDLLARVVAPYIADDRGEHVRPLFASDTHFKHQAARLFLLPAPFGSQRKLWARRKRELQASREYGRLNWRARVYTFKRLTDTLGVFALGASNAIRRQSMSGDERSLANFDQPPTESTK